MTHSKKILAFDFGAESGRGILGQFDGTKVHLEVVHRFANVPVWTLDSLNWDVLHLFSEVLNALGKAGANHGPIDSIGVDTWGVDFALLGRDGSLLANPRHYRDPHTETILSEAFAKVPAQEIFAQTGIQFMRFNSLFQLLAMKRDRSPLLDMAHSMLFMPDLFHYWLTGIKVNELTDASTSQMYDPVRRGWAYDLLKAFDLPTAILGTLVQPGTILGPLRARVVTETGVHQAQVIAPATHDTGSAVAAVPASRPSWAYISSGTWSLMGIETPSSIITEASRRYNFTNEAGVGGTTRVLKNVMGLWLVQECRRVWERAGHAYDYGELARLAEAAPPLASLIDPDDPSFLLPASMPGAIAEYCKKTGQAVPTQPGPVIRCALESLALRYRWVLERLEELSGRRIEVIHIVGGGSQNELLSQLTANACNRLVLAGPVEATALGNILVQALGLGVIGSLAQAREVVRNSFEVRTYEPNRPESWDGHYQRFLGYVAAAS